MNYSNIYYNEILSMDEELKRLAIHTKKLREQRTKKSDQLYYCMVDNNIEKVTLGKNVMTQKKCMPKHLKPKNKPKDQKKAEALEIMRDAGIEDAESLYDKIEEAQKTKNEPEGYVEKKENDNTDYDALGLNVVFSSSKKKRKGNKKEAYDDLLGF